METRALIRRRSTTSRAWYAAGLLVVLLAALLGAWFFSGWHDVRMRQQEVRDAPRKAADQRAIDLARELHGELEALLAREVRRPYFHYQNLMHDPKASLGLSVSPSPLARNPEDKLVLGYFQIDDQGRATTPTINDDFPELSEPENLADNRAFRDQVARDLVRELAPAPLPTPVMVAELSPKPRPQRPPRARPPVVASAEPVRRPARGAATSGQAPPAVAPPQATSPAQQGPRPGQVPPLPQALQQTQVLQLDPDVYAQNSNSNMIYWQQQVENTGAKAAQVQTPTGQAPTKAAGSKVQAPPDVSTPAKTPASPAKTKTSAKAEPTPAKTHARSLASPKAAASQQSSSEPSKASTTASSNVDRGTTSTQTPAPRAAKSHASMPPASQPTTRRPAKPRAATPVEQPPAPVEQPPAPVTITISPLEWQTRVFAGGPALIAVRQVQTPDGNLVQGFVIDRSTLTTSLSAKAGDMVAELHVTERATTPRDNAAEQPVATRDAAAEQPATAGDDGQLGTPSNADKELASTGRAVDVAPGWQLTVSPNPRTLAQATAAAQDIARTFLIRFFGIGTLAMLAAGSVLLLVMRAEKLARERSQFAAAAAHELRTPLAGLQLYGDMLSDGLGDPAKVRDYARRMSEEASRLGRVVSNVLGFSQLERGNLSVEVQVGPLGEALRELAERAEPALDRAGAALELDVAPDLRARFDRDALARIVGNLLDNAEKYARGADDRTIRLAARDRGDIVEVIVQDHGPGVADRTKLFRAFSRGVTSDGPAGLGLGLALSQSLAEAMGGKLAYRPGGGPGATFVLELPRA